MNSSPSGAVRDLLFGDRGGRRKPIDVKVMFRMLVLQSLYNRLDEEVEYQVRDCCRSRGFWGSAPRPSAGAPPTAVRGKDPLTALNIKALRVEIAHYCALGARVIDQARRRVLEGEQVPTSEKIYSIFEPHSDLIKRAKVRTPVEFSHKVFLAESAARLMTQYEVLKGKPVDEVHVAPSIRRHRRVFRHAPALYGADRCLRARSTLIGHRRDADVARNLSAVVE
jgi:hypothetical protein